MNHTPTTGQGDNYYVLRAIDIGARIDGYPEIANDGSTPVFTYEDGPPTQIAFTGVAVIDPAIDTSRPVMAFDDINGTVSVTRQRLVVFCGDYDKGAPMGCGIGLLGVLLTAGIWLFRRLRAQQRSKDKILVGQIYRENIVDVAGEGDMVVVSSRKPQSGSPIILTISFPSNHEADYVRASLRSPAAGPTDTHPTEAQ